MMQKRTLFSLMLISLLVAFTASLSLANTVTIESKSNLPRCVTQSVNITADVTDPVQAIEVVLEITEGANGEWVVIDDFVWDPTFTALTDRVVDLTNYADGAAPDDVIRIAAMALDGGPALEAGTHTLGTIHFTIADNCGGDTVRFNNTVLDYPKPTCEITTQYVDAAANTITQVAVVEGKLHIMNSDPTLAEIDDVTIHWDGASFIYAAQGNDQDLANSCEELAYTVDGPEGMTIGEETGVIQWDQDGDDVGEHTVTVRVTDKCGAYAEESFVICVYNIPPTIACPTPPLMFYGDTLLVVVDGTDDDGGPYVMKYTIESYTTPTAPEIVGSPYGETVEIRWISDLAPEYTGEFEICVSVTDSGNVAEGDCNPENSASCCFGFEVFALEAGIQNQDGSGGTSAHGEPPGGVGVIQGQKTTVSIDGLPGAYYTYPIAGFNFLVAYDASALSFIEAKAGAFVEACEWEYFTYRYGPDGNCGMGCPSGLVRIVAMAEINNGSTPAGLCFTHAETELAVMHFLVSNDHTLECQFVPIRFFWIECTDNVMSDPTGEFLMLSRLVWDFNGALIGTPDFLGIGPDTLPSYRGAPDECLEDTLKVSPRRWVDFRNGGVQIACHDSIDAPGDINVNGIPYEVADAVMFTNYFLTGLDAFEYEDASVAASDCNRDGIALSVADLVYLIRVVVGDAQPYPKDVVAGKVNYTHDIGEVTVLGETEIGAAYLVVAGDVSPVLVADNMEMAYRFDGQNTRIIVTPDYRNTSVTRGFAGEFLAGIDSDILTIEMATIDGLPLAASNVPTRYSLSQNYPNPFNPSTMIELGMPVAGEYRLTIYNIQGQVVDEVSGVAEAPGVVKVEWDASSLASGVYLYRLEANEFSSVKKMVLLK